jgi:hypothetical protein
VGYLVGIGEAPSFPTFGAASSAYFHDDFVITGSGTPPTGQITLRLVDYRARIMRVRIRPASLDVWVSGRGIARTRLELNGADYRAHLDLAKSGRVTLPLPNGLPAHAWLWLKTGHDWLDYRALSGSGGRASRDVETELPQDPT